MASEADRILEKLVSILNQPIVPHGLNLNECQFITPFDSYDDKPDSYRFRADRAPRPWNRDLNARRRELSELFRWGVSHKAANPSRVGNVYALKALYTFPADPSPSSWMRREGDISLPNQKAEAVGDFMLLLAEKARENRELCEALYYGQVGSERDLATERAQLGSESKWVLIGERGVGKTFFLNYAIVAFNDLLHEHRTIWVRLDYSKPYEKAEFALEDWIQWQICKVVFAWYDEAKRQRDIEVYGEDAPECEHWEKKSACNMVFDLGPQNNALFAHARYLDPNVKRADFERVLSAAKIKFAPAGGTPSKIEPWLSGAIWYYLTCDCKVAFVIVIDGLDRLGLSEREKALFARKVEDVRATVMTEQAPLAVYLVTTRYESYRHELLERQLKKFKVAAILQVQADHAWRKKKDYLRILGAVPPHFKEYHKFAPKQYEDIQDLWCESLLSFVAYSLSYTLNDHEATTDIGDGFSILERIFDGNTRLLFYALASTAYFVMAVLPDSFDRFLDRATASTAAEWLTQANVVHTTRRSIQDEFARRYYLCVEALMLESPEREFRRDRYSYSLWGAGREARFDAVPLSEDEFLYNVFHHAWAVTFRTCPHVLATLRAIQYTLFNNRIANRHDLIDFLVTHFRYSKNILDITIDQLLEAGVFRHHVRSSAISYGELELTPRGEFLTDRLVKSLEYVSLALQTAPLPRDLVEQDLFPVRPYSSETFVIDNKIVATVNFLRVLRDLERLEQTYFHEHLREVGVEFYSFGDYRGHSFAIAEGMIKNVQQSIKRMVNSAYSEEGSPLVTQLRDRVLDHPDDYFVFRYEHRA